MNKGFTEEIKSSVPKFKILSKQNGRRIWKIFIYSEKNYRIWATVKL